ncbi:photosynthetic NDH subunit of subcomplex B 3, chloroplastic [Impatiens glandulifera]|uniref:photosynthetic NDH subunit of subcomplex B 3, chloroplastic n=1 Tax=Impatiens glandulifera TaxID=253017 RepID=UPI001FB09108|nr:photosynthetic NDH subunit of subcomplex B 3, chloroplastic [Impatiens glandulifera]
MVMGSLLHLNSYSLASSSLSSSQIFGTQFLQIPKSFYATLPPSSSSRGRIRAIGTIPGSESTTDSVEDPSLVKFAFVSSVLLPDGSPDVHFRSACGGPKLRDIMMDLNIELYGPYSRPLLNCGGGGTCATCLVEVVEGKQLLSPRTEIEKEKLKKKPKNWRLACQTTVIGTTESQDLVVIQQLPEWKAHEWGRDRIPRPPYDDSES